MASPVVLTMFGYEPGAELLGHPFSDFLVPDDRARARDDLSHLVEGTWVGPGDYQALRRDGSQFNVEVNAKFIRDAAGRPHEIVFIVRDVTERKKHEAVIHASLREKEALLKEVHHRVKNNLQIISSLLRLESGRAGDAGVKAAFGEMQHRILSMALLHETLYRSDNLAQLDLPSYLTSLCGRLFRALAPASGRLALHLDLASANVETDQALSCGLLVNELVSNSLKHAFADGQDGTVTVALRWVEYGTRLQLSVRDTGAGLPAGWEQRRATSLGLNLVSDLAQQLGGALEVGDSPPGSAFSVTFTPTNSDAGAARDIAIRMAEGSVVVTNQAAPERER
jgi:PAS domain S-box-containing protein